MTSILHKSDLTENAWPDMLRLYADPAIPPLCVSLQDEFDADVPLLLLLLQTDQLGLACTPESFDSFLAQARCWRETVVRPLRVIRRAMRLECATDAETALREEIKRIELQAERLHVARLVAAFPAETGAIHALAGRYLAQCGVPPERAQASLSLFGGAYARQTAASARTVPNHPFDQAEKATAS